MPVPAQSKSQNLLLQAMASEDYEHLAQYMTSANLPAGEILQAPGEELKRVHFLRSGIASVIITGRKGEEVDLGQVGHEGFCGRSNAIGVMTVTRLIKMVVSGDSWSIPIGSFQNVLAERPNITLMLTRFFYVFHLQITQTLLTTARYNIRQRLARLLLMFQDRAGTNIAITHEQFSQMLAVRRAGVTEALQALEGSGAVRSTRGSVRILDRGQLIELADGTYGGPEQAYQQLLPLAPRLGSVTEHMNGFDVH